MTRLLILLLLSIPANAAELSLSKADASRYATLVLNCVNREFPNKPEHVITDRLDVRTPKSQHPAFYGCYDWHSCVHGHWLLIHLLRVFPDLPESTAIRSVLSDNLSADKIQAELSYLEGTERASFERTYGWAWLLKLAEELHGLDDPDGHRWYSNLKPLSNAIAARYIAFFPKQTYPIRTGVHPNTAFALSFALDYAISAGDSSLELMVRQRARDYFSRDRNYPAAWEPSGEDFFSPALIEADLMRRVMKPKEFAGWFHRFLPSMPPNLALPATVTDRADPKLVHLDGLNLSRAWTMRFIAAGLPPQDPMRKRLSDSAMRHAKDALANVASGHYAGEHWLATFAVYLYSTPEP